MLLMLIHILLQRCSYRTRNNFKPFHQSLRIEEISPHFLSFFGVV